MSEDLSHTCHGSTTFVYVLLKDIWHADWVVITGIPGKDPWCWAITDETGKRHGSDRGFDLKLARGTFERNASK